jgi:uncharacterized iron-regulated membrane protein
VIESGVAFERNAQAVAGRSARKVWVQIHLWLGLTFGIVGALLGVTGSVLVYDRVIDGWLNPGRYRVTGELVALHLADYAQRAEAAVGGDARAINLRLPDEAGTPVIALVRARGEGGAVKRVYLDPPSGRILDAPTDRGLTGWAHDVHGSLSLREYRGRDIVGVVGIAMLISSLSGLYLWWPRRRLGFRAKFPLSRNLHYTFGFYGSLVLATVSFTGILISFPEVARISVAFVAPLSEPPRSAPSMRAANATLIGADRAAEIARSLYPDATVTAIAFPAGAQGVYRIALREVGDTSVRPVTQVWLDPGSGDVMRRVDRASQTRGDAFLALQRPLHEGAGVGGVGRAMVFAVGWLPPVFVVTGAIMWLRGRRRGKRRESSRYARSASDKKP